MKKNDIIRDPGDPELRQDPVTGDWVILAAGRSKRPHELVKKQKRARTPKKDCPFEHLRSEEEAIRIYYADAKKSDWAVQVIANKYPLVHPHKMCSTEHSYGPYKYATGIGHHDVVITRDHDANFSRISPRDAFLVFKAFRDRHVQVAQDPCVHYFFALHNWGPRAGASIYHPHYQTVSLPVVPPDVFRSLQGSKKYYARHKACVHCKVIEWERKQKHRIVFENAHAVSLIPYASRFPFEMKVYPKRHSPYFEDSDDTVLRGVSRVLQKTLSALSKKVNDPDYNFYIHTSPIVKKKDHGHYHWHVEVLPKISTIASLEIGTGVEVNTVHPGDAAKILRGRS